MIKKLSSLGFSNSALVWLNAYLINRTQSIVTNGVVSDSQPIHFGIPQGSILGPLLFVYINDLPSMVSDCSIQLYADDTILFFSSKLLVKSNLAHLMILLTSLVGSTKIFSF